MCLNKTEEFISKVKNKGIHKEGHYSYDDLVYVKSKEKVKIYCNRCNRYFMQTPSSHLSGNGCKACGLKNNANKRTKDTDWFLTKLKEKKIHKNGHYSYNETVYIKNNQRIKIHCNRCDEDFWQEANTHLQGHGCKKCGAKHISSNLRKNTSYFLSKLKEENIHEKGHYSYNEAIYTTNKEKVKIHCNKCDIDFWQTPSSHLNGSGCNKCGIKKRNNNLTKDTSWFLAKLKRENIHEKGHYSYEETIYKTNKDKLKIHCNRCDEDFWQMAGSHLQGRGCRGCKAKSTALRLTKDTNWFFTELNKRNLHKEGHYSYNETVYTSSKGKIKIHCNKCGEDFFQAAYDHLQGHGCNKCKVEIIAKINRKDTHWFLSKLKKDNVHEEGHYNYDETVYKLNKEKVKIHCNRCNKNFWQRPNAHLKGAGCIQCKGSKMEKTIRLYLQSNRIKFKQEKTFNTCKAKRALRFDFFISSHNLLIEAQGKQHYEPLPFFGGEAALKLRQARDQIKRNWAKYSPYRLVEIPYTDFNRIEEILEAELAKPVTQEPLNLFAQ